MKKFTLHHFHRMEIEKQQQNIINGGDSNKDYCICTGPGCGCACIWSAGSNANSYSESYYQGSGGDNNTTANDITRRG